MVQTYPGLPFVVALIPEVKTSLVNKTRTCPFDSQYLYCNWVSKKLCNYKIRKDCSTSKGNQIIFVCIYFIVLTAPAWATRILGNVFRRSFFYVNILGLFCSIVNIGKPGVMKWNRPLRITFQCMRLKQLSRVPRFKSLWMTSSTHYKGKLLVRS